MAKFVLTAQLQLKAPRNVAAVARQIQNQLNNVKINVAVQGAATASRDIDKVTKSADRAATSANRMGKAFAVSIKRFAAFSIATRAVGLFTRGLGDAVGQAIDFERELIKVSQVTGKSMANLRGLTKEITRLSTSLGVSSKSLISVSRVLSQAGLNAKETEIALGTLARTELAPTFENITQTAEGAIAIFNQFGKGAGALEKQLGSINAVAGKFAVEAGDLISVIRRTGGVFKSAGGDLNELLALFTSVRSTTRESAESIATGLRTIFTRIQRPKTIKFLKEYGVELLDLEGKFVGPFEAVKRLSGAMRGLQEGDITFIKIAEQLGGFRQIGKVLPLLQQNKVAIEALAVARAADNSLTDDANKAQAALAVRITKVKEEWVALIRELTESKTFQLMTNAALSLASALIKIASALKEILPVITAIAAVKLFKGMAGFAGGLAGGMKGGVKGMASGGLVPGSGNRDTVPAMLTPGEFVVRKQSVNSIGTGNLEGMNRYAAGGKVSAGRHAYGPSVASTLARTKKKTKKPFSSSGNLRFAITPNKIGAFFMNPAENMDASVSTNAVPFKLTNLPLLAAAGRGRKKGRETNNAVLQSGKIRTFYPALKDIKKGMGKIVSNQVQQSLGEATVAVAKTLHSKGMVDIPPVIDAEQKNMYAAAREGIEGDQGAIKTTSGYIFEGVIAALTGAKPATGKANFDFPMASVKKNRVKLGQLFGSPGSIANLAKADAKATFSPDIIKGKKGGSIVSKVINDINLGLLNGVQMLKSGKHAVGGVRVADKQLGTEGSYTGAKHSVALSAMAKDRIGGSESHPADPTKPKLFATGGPVGTDTVPALLTPGEFVVNKKSSQAIGYSNLANMNRFAAGGKVGAGRHAYGAGDSKEKLRMATPVSRLTDAHKLATAKMKGLAESLHAMTAPGNAIDTGMYDELKKKYKVQADHLEEINKSLGRQEQSMEQRRHTDYEKPSDARERAQIRQVQKHGAPSGFKDDPLLREGMTADPKERARLRAKAMAPTPPPSHTEMIKATKTQQRAAIQAARSLPAQPELIVPKDHPSRKSSDVAKSRPRIIDLPPSQYSRVSE